MSKRRMINKTEREILTFFKTRERKGYTLEELERQLNLTEDVLKRELSSLISQRLVGRKLLNRRLVDNKLIADRTDFTLLENEQNKHGIEQNIHRIFSNNLKEDEIDELKKWLDQTTAEEISETLEHILEDALGICKFYYFMPAHINIEFGLKGSNPKAIEEENIRYPKREGAWFYSNRIEEETKEVHAVIKDAELEKSGYQSLVVSLCLDIKREDGFEAFWEFTTMEDIQELFDNAEVKEMTELVGIPVMCYVGKGKTVGMKVNERLIVDGRERK